MGRYRAEPMAGDVVQCQCLALSEHGVAARRRHVLRIDINRYFHERVINRGDSLFFVVVLIIFTGVNFIYWHSNTLIHILAVSKTRNWYFIFCSIVKGLLGMCRYKKSLK